MAKKGQKFNNYTKELKEEILNKYFNEHEPAGALARKYNISRNTIFTWIYKSQSGEKELTDTKTARLGRPKKEIGEIDYKERYEILKKYQAFLKARREKR